MNATPLYPLPNATNIIQAFQYSNTVTSDLFTPLMMVCFFIVSSVGMSHVGIERSFVAGSFLTMIVSYLFLVGGRYAGVNLIPEYIPIAFTLLTAIGLIVMKR